MPDRETQLRILEEINDGLAELLYKGKRPTLELKLRAFNIHRPRAPAGSPDGGQWVDDESSDALHFVVYRGRYHDEVRDQVARDLREDGANVVPEVLLTLPTHQLTSARIDLPVQNLQTTEIYAVEIKTGEDLYFIDDQKIVYPHLQRGNSVFTLDLRNQLSGPQDDIFPPADRIIPFIPNVARF